MGGLEDGGEEDWRESRRSRRHRGSRTFFKNQKHGTSLGKPTCCSKRASTQLSKHCISLGKVSISLHSTTYYCFSIGKLNGLTSLGGIGVQPFVAIPKEIHQF